MLAIDWDIQGVTQLLTDIKLKINNIFICLHDRLYLWPFLFLKRIPRKSEKMKLKVLSTITIIVFLGILLPVIIVLFNDTEFEVYDSFIENDSLSQSVVFLSDTQDPIWIETFWLDENNNVEIKKSIFDKIIGHNPKAIFHMGDLTALGFLNRDWIEIDKWVNRSKTEIKYIIKQIGKYQKLKQTPPKKLFCNPVVVGVTVV